MFALDKRGRLGAAVFTEQRRQRSVAGDRLWRTMPRAFRLFRPGIRDPAFPVELQFTPVVNHVVSAVCENDAHVGRVAVLVEQARVALQHRPQIFPRMPAILGAIQHAATRRRPAIAPGVIADVEIPVAAGGGGKEETIDRPFERRRAGVNRITSRALERIKRRIAINRMPQPRIHLPRFGIINRARRADRAGKGHRKREQDRKLCGGDAQ